MTKEVRPLAHRTNADGSVVCRHRDLSCCPTCAAHPYVVEVIGAHFYIEDAGLRGHLLEQLAESERV